MASGFQLDWSDYLILAIIFIISIVIGLIPACTGGKQRTTDEYISGNRKLRLFPVALSLLVTYMSGITLLGVGTETYFFGIQYIFWMVGQIMGAILAMVMYVPLLYPLGITSTNEVSKLMQVDTDFGNCWPFPRGITSRHCKDTLSVLMPGYP